jgi:hypothetical protein
LCNQVFLVASVIAAKHDSCSLLGISPLQASARKWDDLSDAAYCSVVGSSG